MQTLNEIAAKHAEYQISMRRHFHAYPEVGGNEVATRARIGEELTAMGISWREIGRAPLIGIVADIEGSTPGKTILLRSDMDALPVEEMNECEYVSRNKGVSHACGHDCHMSMLLTAAKILLEMRDRFSGRVRLLFQPSEETATGALEMIRAGVLEGVDAVFGIHVWSDIDSGKVSMVSGPRMAAADKYTIDIQGKGGHGAQPQFCHDAAVATAAIVGSLQTIVSREIDPTKPAVVTVGVIDVGSRWNVVADSGRIEGTTRCFDPEVRKNFPAQLQRIAGEVAAAYRCEAKVNYDFLVAPTINNPKFVPFARKACEEVFGAEWEADYGVNTGGEDFGFLVENVPGAIALVGSRKGADSSWPQHSCHFNVDEDILLKGAQLHVSTALNFLAS